MNTAKATSNPKNELLKFCPSFLGMAILYVKLQKALHGLLRSALLFYRKLAADLESNGFVLNPHDSCVANKKVANGKKMTVWHVDNLKVSHCDPNQVTIFGEWLSKKYGVAVATHCEQVHNYLGTIFDFLAKGKVTDIMMEYIKVIIKDFPEEIRGNKIFPVAMAFHHLTAQFMLLSAKARRGIQPATAFLTT
jgi:hypothetical protein